jgi:hypothetical protein
MAGEEVDDDVEWGTQAPADERLPSFEEKYREQMRQIVTQKIDLPISALLPMLKEQIRLNPDFQRRDRWTEAQQSRLIESLIMNVPIPPVFLGEDEYGHYVVLDGRQRLTAIKRFLENVLKLRQLDVWNELNGKTFSDLVKRGEEKFFLRRFIPAVVILKESSPQVKYDVFDRLNTGGVKANDMEIRNAIYRGPFTEVILELSRHATFRKLWGIPVDEVKAEGNKLYSKMGDLELVLRFFALREFEKMGTKFSDYLGEFMAERNDHYRGEPGLAQADRESFGCAVESVWKVFGEAAFTRKSGRKSVPLADAVMVSLSKVNPATLGPERSERLRMATAALLEDASFVKAISTGTNGQGAISERIRRTQEAYAAALA